MSRESTQCFLFHVTQVMLCSPKIYSPHLQLSFQISVSQMPKPNPKMRCGVQKCICGQPTVTGNINNPSYRGVLPFGHHPTPLEFSTILTFATTPHLEFLMTFNGGSVDIFCTVAQLMLFNFGLVSFFKIYSSYVLVFFSVRTISSRLLL